MKGENKDKRREGRGRKKGEMRGRDGKGKEGQGRAGQASAYKGDFLTCPFT